MDDNIVGHDEEAIMDAELPTTTTTVPEDPPYPKKKYSNATHAYKSLGIVGKKFDKRNMEDSDFNEARELFSKWDKFYREQEKVYQDNHPEAYERHHAKLKAGKLARQAKRKAADEGGKSGTSTKFVLPQDEVSRKIFEGRVMEVAEFLDKFSSEFTAKKQRVMECLTPAA